MPLYEYRCTQCGHRYDKIQKFNDEPETACPRCGGELERPLAAPALQFKGSGWYVSDYASKPASSSGEKSPAEAATGDAKSAESKPVESKSAAAEPKTSSAAESAPKPSSGSSAS